MKRNACGHAGGRSRTSRGRLRSCLVGASVCRLRIANHGILEPSASASSAGRRCHRKMAEKCRHKFNIGESLRLSPFFLNSFVASHILYERIFCFCLSFI
uniref:Uncharacterized protein n=1 Tax=Cacopsylla melanoneura TaxID=428564 RepID=A0A8D9DVD6_9HEMI